MSLPEAAPMSTPLVVGGSPLRGGGPPAELGGDPAAGGTGPYKANIPQTDGSIRLPGCLRLLPLLLFLPLHLLLDGPDDLLLGRDIPIVLGNLALSPGDLLLIPFDLRRLLRHQRAHRLPPGLRGLLEFQKRLPLLLQLPLPAGHLLPDLAVLLQLLPVVIGDLRNCTPPG